MRKWLLWCCLWLTAFVMTEHQAGFAQEKEIVVLVDGSKVEFDVLPILQEGRTLVPFRAIAEVLGVDVSWESTSQTVTATRNGSRIVLQIGNETAWVNGNPMILDVPPVLSAGRTLIPLRFFSESLGAEVDFDAVNRAVKIVSPPSSMKVLGFYALGSRQNGSSSWSNLFGAEFPQRSSNGYTELVDELGLGWYSLDADGSLLQDSSTGWRKPEGWESVLEAAKEETMTTEMVVHLPDRDSTMENILKNEAATQKAILSMVEEAKRYHMGINLDIEGLGFNQSPEQLAETRRMFTEFVRKLSNQAKEQGLTVTLTLHPLNSAYRGYDYKALGELADAIVVMAYEYHTLKGTPEPLRKVQEAIVMALAEVPAEKLILGITVVNETGKSIVEKVGLAKRYKLKGIALWRLGLVNEEQGQALRKSILPRSE
ncbi:stalk domain-containing protein [Ammoniphilus sp. YIM 78166]|uniref:stalk domain-containing protein n=1 Tax=Ammoniphilus sp. YIM 78166 TaxID=1644106 RepID=UPI00106FCBE3|nr:stalk domain-containing protein [Ammoniphilus sp. YIM 78166]